MDLSRNHCEDVFFHSDYAYNLFVIISGPSAGGKTTLSKLVAQLFANDVRLLIKHTDRNPRCGEIEGRDYYFLPPAAFDSQLTPENSLVKVNRYEHRYGLSIIEVQKAIKNNKRPVFILDPNAALKFKSVYQKSTIIFVAPEEMTVVERRIVDRNDEKVEKEKRLALLQEEYNLRDSFDYNVFSDEGIKIIYEILHNM